MFVPVRRQKKPRDHRWTLLNLQTSWREKRCVLCPPLNNYWSRHIHCSHPAPKLDAFLQDFLSACFESILTNAKKDKNAGGTDQKPKNNSDEKPSGIFRRAQGINAQPATELRQSTPHSNAVHHAFNLI